MIYMNLTYINAKKVISGGSYEAARMATLLDLYLAYDRITVEQYTELMDLMKTVKG